MQVCVSALASLIQGQLHGPGDRVIRSATTLEEAGPEDISFVENERHLKHLKTCRAGALVLPRELAPRVGDLVGAEGHSFSCIVVADPLSAFVAIYRHLEGTPTTTPTGVSPHAVLHPTARIGPDCTIHPLAVVGENSVVGARCVIHPGVVIGANCRVGDDCLLYPQVVLYDRCTLGNRVIVHANAVLGADGFGYRFAGGKHIKVPHLGGVVVGDDVEIGAGSTIDRGTFQMTHIGEGTKIDNLVQIAHNCHIGRHNILCALVGIAGSCRTGDHVILAGGAGIADHVHIGDRAVIGAHSGVPNDVDADARVLGYPSRPERETRRIFAAMTHLPDMVRDLRQVKQQLETLTTRGTQEERKAG